MPFRILSLDGGGIRGLVSAYMLQEIEAKLKENNKPPLREHFDMIAGTSTGSILAAGIALGYPIKDLIDIYKTRGLEIFPYQKLFDMGRLKLLLKYGLSAPKFSNEGLINVLKNERRFKKPDGSYISMKEVGQDGKNPIVLILAYDTRYRNTTLFTNYHTPEEGNRWYNKLPLWQICVSSASAPTFFPAYELKHHEENKDKGIKEEWSFPHVDGGVTANNPSLCAIARAIQLGHKLEDISVLSIGTGENKKPLSFKEIEGWGLIQWGLRISDVFMEGQAEIQSRICTQLMGGAPSRRYLRLQFDLNKAFGEPENYLAQSPILPKKERKNFWTRKHIQESMDDAREDNINQLADATKKYLSRGYVFESRFEHYGSVGDEIEQFILDNPEPRACIKK
ncbi:MULTISPECIES: patatin-like phospholipase family protein [unclassified Coleofasciculus]|uniref:patatin-like phospholipase family protein n=1 Tax=unclassified Coleofasciculus TaxID=2692782 RepID=UPI00187E0BED|nr:MULTISPECIES: patatin-like phospholipase family protein [unclassified Coleofasciculus]MBE9128504.1 patatin-like phospholipase family protein [Coleofasciculus sp. LEGE 07081]MBE9151061.1 patatin-like phospholipase family protein [Coleofasciculus sp. LEGE 07092]